MCFGGWEKRRQSVPCGGSMRAGTGCGVCYVCLEEAQLVDNKNCKVDKQDQFSTAITEIIDIAREIGGEHEKRILDQLAVIADSVDVEVG